MSFPTELSNAVDGVTEVIAAHLNNLEAKVGIDNSAVSTSLDYLLKNAASINPGHKHSKLWAATGSLEAVTVDTNGYVGIGTTSPDSALNVIGRLSMNVHDNTAFFRGYAIDSSRYWSFYPISGDMRLWTSTTGDLLTFKGNGNIGIGKANPGYLLDMEASGGGYYSASDHAWHNGSSIRWKEDIQPIKNPLALLQQLVGVTFKWKDTSLLGMSLIAEEVGRVIPEAVSYSREEPEFCDGFNPGALVGLLVEAVKAQQAQIELLQAKCN